MIYIGSDHAGYPLKEQLKAKLEAMNLPYTDCGCGGEPVDYPDIAKDVCQKVLADNDSKGILICGTGIGISMAANRHSGIRAALCGDIYSAKYTRLHNDANVLCLGGRVTGVGVAEEIVEVFFATDFEGGRHANRIAKL